MSKKTIGLIAVFVGVVVLAGSLLADIIGVSTDRSEVGWLQLLGAGLGLVVALLGFFLTLRKKA